MVVPKLVGASECLSAGRTLSAQQDDRVAALPIHSFQARDIDKTHLQATAQR
jgi:hypothetical protein